MTSNPGGLRRITTVGLSLKVPVHGADELLGLFQGPVGRQEEGDQGQLQVQEGEQGQGHVAPDVLPVPVGNVPHHALSYIAKVKGVHQQELVALPEKTSFLSGLEQCPAETGEGGGHLQDQPFAAQGVASVGDYH